MDSRIILTPRTLTEEEILREIDENWDGNMYRRTNAYRQLKLGVLEKAAQFMLNND